MKSVVYYAAGTIDRPDSLVDAKLPDPMPQSRDLLVEVKAISVNPADTKARASSAPPAGEPRVLGWDAAGVVRSVGSEVTLFQTGDEVFYAGDITRPGAYAERHAVDERLVGRKPRSLDWAHAAVLPLTSLTAWELLFDRLRVPYGVKTQPGKLLIINGAGGVGSMLIQLARRLTGLTIVATASRPESVEWVTRLGAHHVIDHRAPLDAALRAIGIEQVEYVAGLTATDRHLPAIIEVIAPQGHLALIDDPATLDIVGLKRKAVTVSWELMFTRSMFRTPDMIRQHEILEEVAALVDAGLLISTLNGGVLGTINAANLKRAHALLESGRSIGKLALAGF